VTERSLEIFIPDLEAAERVGLAAKLSGRLGFRVRVGSSFSTSEEELRRTVGDAEVLCVSVAPVSARVIEAAPALRLIVKCGIGTEAIDVGSARQRGISVVRTSGVNYRGVPEFVIGAAIAHFRRFRELDAATRRGEWQARREAYSGRLRELRRATIGIVGLGAIGRETARLAAAFGMRVLGADPYVARDLLDGLPVELVDLDALLRESDVVTLHPLLTAETRRLISARELALMKPDALLVNTSRGPVVDEAALAEALRGGTVGGAALDVYEAEPLAPDSPLVGEERCLLSPHLQGCADAGYDEIGELAAEHVIAYAEGQPLRPDCIVTE
jgi:D-3-phosphoglycerate dehydrogenase